MKSSWKYTKIPLFTIGQFTANLRFLGSPFLHNFPVLHMNHSRPIFRNCRIMGHHHHCHALPIQLLQQLHHHP